MGYYKNKSIEREEDNMTDYIKNVTKDIVHVMKEGCDKFKDINYTLAVESQIEDVLQKRLDELFITIRENEYDNQDVHREKEKVQATESE